MSPEFWVVIAPAAALAGLMIGTARATRQDLNRRIGDTAKRLENGIAETRQHLENRLDILDLSHREFMDGHAELRKRMAKPLEGLREAIAGRHSA